MAKQSAMYLLYADRLSRCQSPEELLKLSREIAGKSFRGDERVALMLSCVFIAKQFDKHGAKLKEGVPVEIPALDYQDQV